MVDQALHVSDSLAVLDPQGRGVSARALAYDRNYPPDPQNRWTEDFQSRVHF